jgi:hypothetical protein
MNAKPGESNAIRARILTYAAAFAWTSRPEAKGDCRQPASVGQLTKSFPGPRESIMRTHILRGSKQEIAESLVRISGEVREAIVFVEEAAPVTPGEGTLDAQEIFAEMRTFMVDVTDVDDSREAVYSRMDGE